MEISELYTFILIMIGEEMVRARVALEKMGQ